MLNALIAYLKGLITTCDSRSWIFKLYLPDCRLQPSIIGDIFHDSKIIFLRLGEACQKAKFGHKANINFALGHFGTFDLANQKGLFGVTDFCKDEKERV